MKSAGSMLATQSSLNMLTIVLDGPGQRTYSSLDVDQAIVLVAMQCSISLVCSHVGFAGVSFPCVEVLANRVLASWYPCDVLPATAAASHKLQSSYSGLMPSLVSQAWR